MTKLSLPRALSDPPPHHRSCPLYYFHRSLVDHPWTDSNEYRISWPGKGGKCVRDGRKLADAIATVNRRDRGEDDERKNFVSINNSDPVLRRRNPPTAFPPSIVSVRKDSSFLPSPFPFHPRVGSFVSSVKEGREGGSKNLIFS